jgi:hypothetical protein
VEAAAEALSALDLNEVVIVGKVLSGVVADVTVAAMEAYSQVLSLRAFLASD